MAQPNRPLDNVSYDPLPLEHPPSPVPGASFNYSPHTHSLDLPGDDLGLPEGAAQPRFLGQALYQDGPSARNSYASSHQTFPSQSEYSSSVYALNDTRDPQSLSNYEGQYRDDPHEVAEDSGMSMSPIGRSRHLSEKRAAYSSPKSKRKIMIIAAIAALIIIILAVVIPVYFAIVKPNSTNSESSNSSGDSSHNGGKSGDGSKGSTGKVAAVTGGDGSQVTLEDGTTFKYSNSYGGSWYYDVNDPFNNGARAQSWTPALNETFDHNANRIRGVNLGGWFTIEPFIVPALFEKYQKSDPMAIDEWTLHTAMAADAQNGGLNQIEDHYKTFITEQDFAEIAAAGLNYVRIPIPYWLIETWPGEPFLAKVGWKYFVKALGWARKYGIRVNLDLHAVPGSQNGWNHSGRLGEINLLRGVMGYANAQRTLDYIRILAEFICQPQYRDVVTMFGILNEPRGIFMGEPTVFGFYAEGYRIVRQACGDGKGPWVSFHDAFFSRNDFKGYLANADRIALDSHPYIAFGGQTTEGWGTRTGAPCAWGKDVNQSMADFGMTIAGEFSNAINDCGLWVNGVGQGVRYDGTFTAEPSPRVGDCTQWTDWTRFDDATKTQIKQFAMASMDGLYNYFFWTWKIGNSSASGRVESPAWSYKLGYENGWMPKNSREADGFCQNTDPFTGTIQNGNGQVNLAQYPWPPASIMEGGPVANLPTYTASGAIPTLTGATLTVSGLQPTKSVDLGNGWANANDNAGAMTKVSGCNYPDPWVGIGGSVPTPWCAGQKKRKEEAFVLREPLSTPPPRS
ncbi:hypothetical protein E1B28_002522 [Marasmius oreades]|uniref:glucan 1,3-beta-glucosidase n=1 Tax=Marasmius oreades TaxID=181124 RepID=A0A9P7RMV4_9AGAR|nr:uncharacterized protein E1B28_002522 [Marasmius oreades]KAG7086576.1 hypothetical protein E1B28_002522 [Marasmius oreades]